MQKLLPSIIIFISVLGISFKIYQTKFAIKQDEQLQPAKEQVTATDTNTEIEDIFAQEDDIDLGDILEEEPALETNTGETLKKDNTIEDILDKSKYENVLDEFFVAEKADILDKNISISSSGSFAGVNIANFDISYIIKDSHIGIIEAENTNTTFAEVLLAFQSAKEKGEVNRTDTYGKGSFYFNTPNDTMFNLVVKYDKKIIFISMKKENHEKAILLLGKFSVI